MRGRSSRPPTTTLKADSPTAEPTAANGEHLGGSAYRVKLFSTSTPANLNATLLLSIVLLLVGFGLVMVLSSSAVEEFAAGNGFSSKFLKQLLFAVVGIPLMLVASRVPLAFWTGSATWLFLGGTVILQALVFTPLGIEVQGNRSWLDLGVTTIQPAEFAKVVLCVWLGFMVQRKGEKLEDWRQVILPIGLPVAIVIGLALLGEDLGTVMVLGVLVLGAMWFGGMRKRFLLVVAIAAVVGAITMAAISPNRVNRITSFFSGDCDYEDLCWQTSHGFFALARGGFFGVGLGNSTAKWSWLPEADNDFIFAIIGEEFGFIGAFAVVVLFVALAIVLLRIWRGTTNPAGRVVVGGVFSWIMYQAFVNIAVVLGLLPVLGVPLPFLSSGGSALVTTLGAIGIVLSVARDSAREGPANAPTRKRTVRSTSAATPTASAAKRKATRR